MSDRDPGAPFPGESLELDYVEDVTGSAIGTAGPVLKYRGRYYSDDPQETVTASAGDSFLVHIWPASNFIEPDDQAVVSWVLVTDGGTATLRFSDGLDTSWGSAGTGGTPNGLGTVTTPADGGDVVVGASSAITVAAIAAFSAQPALFVEVLSGSVTIRQIKLRVWPGDTPLGGYGPTTLPEWVTDSTNPAMYHGEQDFIGHARSGDAFAAYDAAWLAASGAVDLSATTTGTSGDVPVGAGYGASVGQRVDETDFGATWQFQVPVVYVVAPKASPQPGYDPTLVWGRDYFTPPDEVLYDPLWGGGIPQGDPVVQWDAGSLHLAGSITYRDGQPTRFPDEFEQQSTIHWGLATLLDRPTVLTEPGTTAVTVIDGSNSVGHNYSGTVWQLPGEDETFTIHPAAGVPALRLTGHSSWVETAPPFLGDPEAPSVGASGSSMNGSASAQLSITYRVRHPPFLVWTLTQAIPLRQRQRDDGLALGGPRWRGRPRSRQASNRWSGYL